MFTRAALLAHAGFADFVRLCHERGGEKKRMIKQAARERGFAARFEAYLAEGCGVQG